MKKIKHFALFFLVVQTSFSYAQHTGEWALISGSAISKQPPVWGTKGIFAAGNTPGARHEAMEWTDTAGNFWIFGGWPISPTPFAGHYGDLWKFDPKIKQWAWMHGTQTVNTFPIYGTKGVAASGNMPTSYCAKPSVADNNGNLWLPITSHENIWKYNTNTNMWTWINGNGFAGTQSPRLGTRGVFSATNNPNGTTENACAWSHNNYLYVYNYFYKSNGQPVGIMWKYNTQTDQWAWVAGDTINGSVYGTRGVSSPQTQPGEFWVYARWKGGDGNFYMMGGIETPGRHSNSLWRFDPTIDQWAWMGGAAGTWAVGNYGTMGVPAPTNWPGSRAENRATWVDKCGNLWMFGGGGYGINTSNSGYLNDLWMYSISSGMWTWKGGTGNKNVATVASAQNIFAPANLPSGREGANGFVDRDGNFWLFGGADTSGFYNDMWMLNTQLSISSANATACLSADGSATVNVFIGEAPYVYSWSSGQTTTSATITNLQAGTYTVTVTDAGGCLQMDTVTIFSGPNTLTTTVTTSICYSGASASVAGGTAPYTYQWNNGQSAQSVSGLIAGTHSVLVTDKNGCTVTDSVVIPPYSPVTYSFSTTPATCSASNGTATIFASGGKGTITYSWSNTNTTSAITSVVAGTYSVSISDSIGCNTSATIIVSSVNPLHLTDTSKNESCIGNNDGMATILPVFGETPYTYNWSTGQTDQSISTIGAGTYSVIVTDKNSCTATHNIIITANANPVANAGPDKSILNGESTLLLATGGVIYNWSPSAGLNNSSISNPQASPTETTKYIVTIIDTNGCTSTDEVEVFVEQKPCRNNIYIPNVFSPNDDGENDVFKVYGNCIVEVVMVIYNRWGERIFENSGTEPYWDGAFKGEELETGVYAYSIKIIADTGESFDKAGNVTLLR